MSGNERKRQKRGDEEEEESRRSSDEAESDSSQNTTAKSSSHPLPKLPAEVWCKHIAPFLHRKDLNNLLSQGGKEIYEAFQDLNKFPWPTVELRLPGVEVDTDSAEVEVLRAISPDSKWIFAAPVTSKGENGRFLCCFTGLYVFHSRYGRAKDVVPLPGRPSSSSSRDFQDSTIRYYPNQISISKDGRYLAVSYREKIEIDLFRLTFDEESKEPSVSLELHRTFELDTSARSPFHRMGQSSNFVLSTETVWLIVGYSRLLRQHLSSDETAIVAWNIESGAIVKSEVGICIVDPLHDILATDSMILWRGHSGLDSGLRAWTIESGNLSNEDSVEMLHPSPSMKFVWLPACPVGPYSFLAICTDSQSFPHIKFQIEMLKLDGSTEASTTVQKLRQIEFPASRLPRLLFISSYPDGQHLLLYHPEHQKFYLRQMAEKCYGSSLPAASRSAREDLVHKANMILRNQQQHHIRNSELSPDGEFVLLQLHDRRQGFVPRVYIVSQCCGNTPEEIRRRMIPT